MPAPIHIATITDVGAPSGQGLRLHSLIKHMASDRTVSLLAPMPNASATLNNQIILTPLHSDTDATKFLQRPFSLDSIRRFRKLFCQLRQFLGSAHTVYTDQPLILLGAKYGARWAVRVIEVNGIYCEEWIAKGRVQGRHDIRYRIMRFIEARALRTAHAVIVVSPGLRDYVIHEFRVHSERVHVIPNGIDPAMLNPKADTRAVQRKLDLTDEPLAVFVGSFRPWHGVHNLIQSLPAALDRIPSLKLVLVGDGPTRPECETLVDDLRLHESVIFAGYQPATVVPDFIATADVCVYYPDYDVHQYGFMGDPIKLREYMAMGKPIVTVKLPNFAEVVEQAHCGLVVDADHRRFGEAVAELILNHSLSQQLGQNGRHVITHKYDWPAITEKILQVIDRASENTR